MIAELESLTKEYFEDEDHTVLDYAIAQIESGKPIAGIAEDLATKLGFPIQRQRLSRYLHTLAPDAPEKIAQARPTMAHAMAEDAIQIVDAKMYDKIDVARAALRARTREGLAKMFNPEFNQPKQGLTLNIGTLHLNALRNPQTLNTDALPLDVSPHARVSFEPALPAESSDGGASS